MRGGGGGERGPGRKRVGEGAKRKGTTNRLKKRDMMTKLETNGGGGGRWGGECKERVLQKQKNCGK